MKYIIHENLIHGECLTPTQKHRKRRRQYYNARRLDVLQSPLRRQDKREGLGLCTDFNEQRRRRHKNRRDHKHGCRRKQQNGYRQRRQ